MKNVEKAVINLLCAKVQLDLIQAAFEWDKKNPWVQRGEGGRFGTSTSSTEKIEENKAKNFLTEKLKEIKNNISSVIKSSNPSFTDTDKREGDDIIEKLEDELKKESEENDLKSKYLELLKENTASAGLTAAALVGLAALLVITKKKEAAVEIQHILAKEQIKIDNINLVGLVNKISEFAFKKNDKLLAKNIETWKNNETPLQKIIEEGGLDYIELRPTVSDNHLKVTGVKVGDSLADDEIQAVKEYCGLDAYVLNNFLRNQGGGFSSTEAAINLEKINKIRTALCKLPRFSPDKQNPPCRFLASEKLVDSFKVGETYIEPGFGSFSKRIVGTGSFNDSNKSLPVKIIVRPAKESIARDITHLVTPSEVGDYLEEEILYLPGSKFKVLNKNQHKFKDEKGKVFKRWVVEVEEHL